MPCTFLFSHRTCDELAFSEALADPAEANKSPKARESILDEKIEYARFVMLFPAILTSRMKANGLGAVDKAALDDQDEYVTEAFGLKSKPDTEQIFNPSFFACARGTAAAGELEGGQLISWHSRPLIRDHG